MSSTHTSHTHTHCKMEVSALRQTETHEQNFRTHKPKHNLTVLKATAQPAIAYCRLYTQSCPLNGSTLLSVYTLVGVSTIFFISNRIRPLQHKG